MPDDGRYRNWWRRIINFVRRLISILRRMCWWPPRSHQQLDETTNDNNSNEQDKSEIEISPESSRLLPTPGQYSPLSARKLQGSCSVRLDVPAFNSRVPAQSEIPQIPGPSRLASKWQPKSGSATKTSGLKSSLEPLADDRLSTSQPLLPTTTLSTISKDAGSLQKSNSDENKPISSGDKSADGISKESSSISETSISGSFSQDPMSCAASSIVSYTEQFHLQPPVSPRSRSRDQRTLSAPSSVDPIANVQTPNSEDAPSGSNESKLNIRSSVLAELLARPPLDRVNSQESASVPCSVLQSPSDERPETINKSSSQGSILARLLSQPPINYQSSSSSGVFATPGPSSQQPSIPTAWPRTQRLSANYQSIGASMQLTEPSTSSSEDVNKETRPRRTSPRELRKSLRKTPSKNHADGSRESSERYRQESPRFISPRRTSPRYRQTSPRSSPRSSPRKTSPRNLLKHIEQSAGPSKSKPSPEHRRKRKSTEICRTPESQTESETDDREDEIKKRPFYKIIPATPTTEESTTEDIVGEQEEEQQMDTGESISEIPPDQSENSSPHDELNTRTMEKLATERISDQTDRSSNSRGIFESASSQEDKESSTEADEELDLHNRTTTDSSAQPSDFKSPREASVQSDLSEGAYQHPAQPGDESSPSSIVKKSVQSPLDFQAIEEESSTSSNSKFKKGMYVRILGLSSSDSGDSLSTLSPLSEVSNLPSVGPPPNKRAKSRRTEPSPQAPANTTQLIPIIPVRRHIELLRPIDPAEPTQSACEAPVIQVDTHAPHSGRPPCMQPLSETQIRYLEENETPVEQLNPEERVQPPRPTRPSLLPLPVPLDPIEILQVDAAAEARENQPVQNGEGAQHRRGDDEYEDGRNRDDPSPPFNGVVNMHGENDNDVLRE